MPHAPAALGNIVSLSGDLPEGSPPTSYAAHAVLKGRGGAILAFGGLTLLRSLLIAPGLALAGIRGKQLLWGSLAGSAVISATALGYVFALDKKKRAEAATTTEETSEEPRNSGVVPPHMQTSTPIDTSGEVV